MLNIHFNEFKWTPADAIDSFEREKKYSFRSSLKNKSRGKGERPHCPISKVKSDLIYYVLSLYILTINILTKLYLLMPKYFGFDKIMNY